MKKLLHKVRNSLSLKLMTLFLITAMVIAIVIQISLAYIIRKGFEENLEPHFHQYVRYLITEVGSPPNIETAKRLTDELPLDIQIKGKDILWSSLNEGFIDLQKEELHTHRRPIDPTIEVGYLRQQNRLLLITNIDNFRIEFLLPTRPDRSEHRFRALALLLLLFIILYLSYRAIRWLFHPLESIQEGIKHIGRGDLGHRITIRNQDELGVLANHINQTADEIEKMLEAKRQLLLAISHELRTPITRAKVTCQLIESEKTRLQLEDDLAEMGQLIELLLEGERLKGRHTNLQRIATDVDQLANDLIETHFHSAPIELTPLAIDSYLLIDPLRLRLLLKNLIENALRYNRSEIGPVLVQLDIVEDQLQITIIDHGEGIAPEELERITQPFYRIDSSRQRITGGFGLGLYLCERICEAHGGILQIKSSVGEGTNVTALLSLLE